ncbi:MAG: CDP-archaeol synthase [Promethearchaeota archaeon]
MRHVKKDPNLSKADLRKELLFDGGIALILILTLVGWAIFYSLLDGIVALGLGFFILLPSFFTNGMMVIAGKIKIIKRYPIDGGRFHKDGNRILGDGKSWNGFIGGWIGGFLVSAAISWWFFIRIYNANDFGSLHFFTKEKITSFISLIVVSGKINWVNYFLSQAIIALGSPLGDMIGSYFKRRRAHKRGEVFLFWDQNDFIIISGLIALIWFPLTWYYWIFLLMLTPILTALSNWLGYLLKQKDVPW